MNHRVISVQYEEGQTLEGLLGSEDALVITKNDHERTAALKVDIVNDADVDQITANLKEKGFKVLGNRPFNAILPVENKKPVWSVPVAGINN
ncbi:MAG: hypothetical protein K9M03_04480 [Kiritimatiellales bacterium]|nr:hypothetical protein [Kiritimatiellales bacterium]